MKIDKVLSERAVAVPDSKVGFKLSVGEVVFNGELPDETVLQWFMEHAWVKACGMGLRADSPKDRTEWKRSDGERIAWTDSAPRNMGYTEVTKSGNKLTVPHFKVNKLFIDMAGLAKAVEKGGPVANMKASLEAERQKNKELEERLAKLEALLMAKQEAAE